VAVGFKLFQVIPLKNGVGLEDLDEVPTARDDMCYRKEMAIGGGQNRGISRQWNLFRLR
jgi:hypothetical protein